MLQNLYVLIGLLFISSLAQAQFIQITSIKVISERNQKKQICIDADEQKRDCYKLTEFTPLVLKGGDQPPQDIQKEAAPYLEGYEWLEVSQFGLKNLKFDSLKSERIPFIVTVRWRAKQIELPGFPKEPSDNPPANTLYAFGFIYTHEYENKGGVRVEMDHYGSQDELPQVAQGLAEQSDAFIFHQKNLIWLQSLLEPVLLPTAVSLIPTSNLRSPP